MRTSRTPGAKRRTILTSVLRTLAKQLREFTLDGVIDEIKRWMVKGRSCFTDQAEAAGLIRPPSDSDKAPLLTRIILEVDNPNSEAELVGV